MNRLLDFSLLSSNSFKHSFLKSKFTKKKFLETKKKINFRRLPTAQIISNPDSLGVKQIVFFLFLLAASKFEPLSDDNEMLRKTADLLNSVINLSLCPETFTESYASKRQSFKRESSNQLRCKFVSIHIEKS